MPTLSITEGLIRQPVKAKTDYFDDKDSGFTLRAKPNGARLFYLVYRANGKPKWHPLGAYSEAFTVKQARAEAVTLRGRTLKQPDIAAALQKQREGKRRASVTGGTTFGVAVAAYLKAKADKRSIRSIASCLQLPLAAWRDFECAEVSDDMAADLLQPLVDAGKNSRANHIQTGLHGFFHWARQPGRRKLYGIEHNPMAGMERVGGKPASGTRALDEAEIRKLWRGLDNPALLAKAKCRPADADAIKLTLCTMLRSGEVVKGQRCELGDDDGPVRVIPKSRGKMHRDIVQPLNSLALEIINRRLADPKLALMFPGKAKDGMIDQPTLARVLTGRAKYPDKRNRNPGHPGLCELLGIKKFGAHDLRRTGSTLVNKKGRDIPNVKQDVERTLDHIQGGVQGTYDVNEYVPEKRVILERLDRELRRIIGLPAGNVVRFKRRAAA